jgi:tetratricopeptide (TPR) repeat protein
MELAAQGRVLYEDGDSYRFDHPQLREVLYAKIPARQRRRKHLAVAERLEADGVRDDRDVAVMVAHHLRLAGTDAPPAPLARSALAAADRSFALAAWSDAATYYDLCLAGGSPGSQPADPYLLWRAGVAHFRNHDHQQADDRLSRAAQVARSAGDERSWGRAVLALTRSRVTGGSWLGSQVDLEPLEEFLRDSHADTADLRARAYSLLSDAYFARFDFQPGFEHATRALEIARRLADDEVTAEVELALGIQHLAALHLDEAEQHLESCATSAARLNDSWARAWAASRLPLVRWCQGDLLDTDRLAVSAAALASAHFDWAEASLANACRTAVAVAQGRTAPAERLGAVAHQQYLRSDYLWTLLVLAPALVAGRAFRGREDMARQAIGLIGLTGIDTGVFDLTVRAILGDVDGVRAGLNEQPIPTQAGPPFSLFDLAFAALRVEVCDLIDDPDLALAAVGPLEAAHAAGFINVVGWVASVPRLLGVVHRCLGRLDESEKWLRRALADAERAPAPVELARTQLNLAHVLGRRGDEAAATTALDQAAAAFRLLGLDALYARAERLRPAVSDPTA